MKFLFSLLLLFSFTIFADSWPQWRFDSGHSAASPTSINAKNLKQIWRRSYSPRKMVWDDPLNWDLMPYDRVFEPVCADNILIVNFNDFDKLVAFDTETGNELWTFRCNGPIRFPASIEGDRVFTVSDDGFLYSLDLKTGKLLWKFNGAPIDRLIVGNRRLISTWPARGGAVVDGGKVWFSSGIWPFMGVFVYCVDAKTGSELWCNSGNHADYIKQPHNTPAFAGLAPQGTLGYKNGFLTVPGGRSVAGVYDGKSGKQLSYRLADNHRTGGSFVCTDGKYFYGHEREGVVTQYYVANGKKRHDKIGKTPVISGELLFFSGLKVSGAMVKNPRNKLWEINADATGDLIKSGNLLIAGGKGKISFIELGDGGKKATLVHTVSVDGDVKRLITADGKLFAVTLEGGIIAFGESSQKNVNFEKKVRKLSCSENVAKELKTALRKLPVGEGFATVYGIGNGDLVKALALHSKLSTVVFDPSEEKIYKWRKLFDDAGIDGERCAFIHWKPGMKTAKYYSILTIINSWKADEDFFKQAYASTRPYGGVLIKKSGGDSKIVVRNGAPKGAADFTHMYGDMTNSLVAKDERVKLPLGLLWFGGNSNMDVLPRHGHGPPQQIVDGVMLIQGINILSARDIYTGKVLWRKEFKDLGGFDVWYDKTYSHNPTSTKYNQIHIPGANTRGTNYVATKEAVYIIEGSICHVIDTKTGRNLKPIGLPNNKGKWGYIGAHKRYLVGTFNFVAPDDVSASRTLAVFDRFSRKVLWTSKSKQAYVHNAIAAIGDYLFVVDKNSVKQDKKLQRHGRPKGEHSTLTCYNIATGKQVWQLNKNVFGRWLGISEENGLLILANRPSRDMISGEKGDRMAAYKLKSGKLVWDKKIRYNNPPILLGNSIVVDSHAFDILTGNDKFRKNPLTGQLTHFSYNRAYGCNTVTAGKNLLLFRSAAAGFYDWQNLGGTGNFGGYKSSCTSNLVPAGGILNSPDYTRTCSCAYQNQTSLALIHIPELEYWTNSLLKWDGKRVEKLGVNFGAPGDRTVDDTLWLEFPFVGGSGPKLDIKVTGNYQRNIKNALLLKGKYSWVGASSISGFDSIELEVNKKDKKSARYDVELFFAEVDKTIKKGQRQFILEINGSKTKAIDIFSTSEGKPKTISVSVKDVKIDKVLTIKAISIKGKPLLSGILLIEKK